VSLIDGSTVAADAQRGFVVSPDLPTYGLNILSQAVDSGAIGVAGAPSQNNGFVGIFNTKTHLSLDIATVGKECCPFYLAGSAIYSNDKIGPFHGGYTETNKSKMINPKYISRMYIQAPCEPQNEVLHIGSTSYTAGGAITSYTVTGTASLAPDLVNEVFVLAGSAAGVGAIVVVSTDGAGVPTSIEVIGALSGKGYLAGEVLTIPGDAGNYQVTVDAVSAAGVDPITGQGGADCCKEFLCGETYNLRVDVKGSPALRFLDHNAYLTAAAYTGCCPDGALTPTPVDSTLVMIEWAKALANYPVISPFMQIAVQDEAGLLYYAPGTSAAFLASVGAKTWDEYVSPGHTAGACAGLILNGAYVDTKFGDCTFQISDFYEKEPVKLYASEVDLNGDPCAFEGLCIVHQCLGKQANGLGETVLRELSLSESYRQNFLHSDLRIREITQGNQIISAINRNALYFGSYLQHNVPRHSNPTGTFDSDQYLLHIVSNEYPQAFEDLAVELKDGCGSLCDFESLQCDKVCGPLLDFPAL
jgi:hypothetical protein